ncbi:MAG: tetrahydrofolate dehydrogenase/cyclohydrolase catalytic domain-containing protein, partial [Vampirovibrionia bacterium]
MTIILDGKALSKKFHKQIEEKIAQLKSQYNKVPGLAVIIVGDNPASQAYVNKKEKVSAKLGMYSKQIKLHENTKEE